MVTTLIKSSPVVQQPFIYTSFNDLPLYEQRYMPRWEVATQSYYKIEGSDEIIKTQTKNLSFTGVSLYAVADIPLNKKLDLKIHLSPEKNFEAKGRVIWKCSLQDVCYIGVVFENLPEKTQELILEYAFEIVH